MSEQPAKQLVEGHERVVKIGVTGVQFGNCWISHTQITGCSVDELNSDDCDIIGGEYMKWLALTEAPTTLPSNSHKGRGDLSDIENPTIHAFPDGPDHPERDLDEATQPVEPTVEKNVCGWIQSIDEPQSWKESAYALRDQLSVALEELAALKVDLLPPDEAQDVEPASSITNTELLDSYQSLQEDFNRLKAKRESDKADAERLRGFIRLCGYVENGSDTVVTLFQDDATRAWYVKLNKTSYYHGNSARSAIDAAIEQQEEAPHA